jgi:putative ABC transport system permease protein
MRLLLAGLWARRGLNVAALLVTVVAMTAAVLGPMYGRASGEHLVDSRIAAQPYYATGLSVALPALERAGGLEAYVPPAPSTLIDQAAAIVDAPGVGKYWGPARRWLRDTGYRLTFHQTAFTAPLYWREGMCGLARISGSCPRVAGEVLVESTMAETLAVAAGDTLTLEYQERVVRQRRTPGGGTGLVEKTLERTRVVHVVGTYEITDAQSPAWYDDSRFTGFAHLDPAAASGPQASADPAAPALLVAPGSMTTQTFVGGVDRLVDTGAVDLATMDETERLMDQFVDRALNSPAVAPAQDQQLSFVFSDVRAERALLDRVMVAALAPLVVLALLLLFALVSAGALVRRPYVALAKLRGHSRAQVFRFAVAEPFLVIGVAVPLALLLATLTAHVVARRWLTPGIPVVIDPTAWGALVVVVLAAATASVVAALEVMREPLSLALASALSQRGGSRTALVLRVAVVAVALASVVQLMTSGDQSSQLLALLAPSLVALAVAVGGAGLLRALSRTWVRRTATTESTPAYLAARRLARRHDLTNLMIPLLLAVSVISFAGSASAVSDDWRVSRARAEVGADRTFRTEVSAGRLMAVTRAVDPEGRYLAAALVQKEGDDAARRLYVDSTRLATVAAWDPSWSEESVAAIAERLRPSADRLTLTGDRLSVEVRDVSLHSSTGARPRLWVQYVNDDGEQRNIELGALRNRDQQVTLSAAVPSCDEGCAVEKLFLTGESLSVLDVDGSLTIAGVEVDGKAVDWGLTDPQAWRAARPFPVSLVDPPVLLAPGPDGLGMEVFLGQLPPGNGPAPTMVAGFAAITPTTTPDVVPVVLTRDTPVASAGRAGSGNAIAYPPNVVAGVGLNGQAVPMEVVARVRSLPLVGSVGSMADLETGLVELEPPPGAVLLPELWATDDTPPRLLDAVEEAGIALFPTASLDDRLTELRGDAFSLGLRLFLVVGLATALLAVFGVFTSAVLQSRWRAYEVASLRVVGVSRRSLLRASMLEYVVMLGLAVVLGLAAAWVAVQLVLPAISLGPADEFAPPPDYATQWSVLGLVGVALFLVASAIAFVVSRRTTRLGRPATLRWAEQS